MVSEQAVLIFLLIFLVTAVPVCMKSSLVGRDTPDIIITSVCAMTDLFDTLVKLRLQ